jgi:hypothetical protein
MARMGYCGNVRQLADAADSKGSMRCKAPSGEAFVFPLFPADKVARSNRSDEIQ